MISTARAAAWFRRLRRFRAGSLSWCGDL